MINVLQGNIGRRPEAFALLEKTVREKNVDIALLSEVGSVTKDSSVWITDTRKKAAIWIVDQSKLSISNKGSGNGYAWIKSGNVTYVSCYLRPPTPNKVDTFNSDLQELEDLLQNTQGGVIVGGDFNSHALDWGSPETNTRGKSVLEMSARLGLIILNDGTTTFRRDGQRETTPDISLASEALAEAINDWQVLDEFNGSDHLYITFTNGQPRKQAAQSAPRWNLAKIDREKFKHVTMQGKTEIAALSTETTEEVERLVKDTMTLIERACTESMPKKNGHRNKPPVYWWNQEIADCRNICQRLRRRTQRARRSQDQTEIGRRKEEERAAKKRLCEAIKRSKTECWKTLSAEVDNDPWGLGYKIVMKKLGKFAKSPPREATVMEEIVNTLFPDHEQRQELQIEVIEDILPFTETELEAAIRSMKNKKAPGPDEIPSEILKLVWEISPEILLYMYNACLKTGTFPKRWKKQKLVLIGKGKGDPNTASGNRPLCMLDTAGKVLEKLIRPRLQAAVENSGGLSNRQFGFRRGKSTNDAVAVVKNTFDEEQDKTQYSKKIVMLATIDVRNAFNSAGWDNMINPLIEKYNIPPYLLRMVDSYLKDRELLYETKDGVKARRVTAGAAQGSILGPELWNISYDDILRIELPEGCYLVGYADDIAIVITGKNHQEIQEKLTKVMARIRTWLNDHGLDLAAEKTEIIFLTKRHKATFDNIQRMNVENQIIESKEAIKYLGFTLDTKMTFGEHTRKAAAKASATATSLSRLMKNIGGPRASKRKLLMSVTNSMLLYGSEIWAETLETEWYRKSVAGAQRRAALRVCSAYCTVSEPAVLAIAGSIPVDLLAMERKRIFDRRREAERAGQDHNRRATAEEERKTIMDIWQTRRERDDRGTWTIRVIPSIKRWVERGHGEVNYYLTQMLSGHGYFRSYLHKREKVESPTCLACGHERDDVEHTFFSCEQWEPYRQQLREQIGEVTPDNIAELMLDSEENWKAAAAYAETVLRTKKRANLVDDHRVAEDDN